MSDNEGERDGEEDGGEEDDDDSDNDLEIVLEQSGTADSTGAASGGTEASTKKVKITLKIFKFFEHHEIRPQIELMKTEVIKYQLLQVPSSHSRKGRIVRGRTHSTCLIGGSQTVQRYQDSRTCSVQY